MEITNGITELMETLEEGLNHIKKQLAELRYEEALMLLADAMEGVAAIEKAIDEVKDELTDNKMDELLKELLGVMNQVLISYERKEELQVENQVMADVIAVFGKWREEVERVVRYNRLS